MLYENLFLVVCTLLGRSYNTWRIRRVPNAAYITRRLLKINHNAFLAHYMSRDKIQKHLGR